MELQIDNQQFILLPQKAIFWKDQNKLIVADTHFGKAAHFRKHGISVPQHTENEDIDILKKIIYEWNPSEILVLGDLFHSKFNESCLIFKSQIADHHNVTLIKGNHDILKLDEYKSLGINLMTEYRFQNILFTHQPIENEMDGFQFFGHLHPSFTLKGRGKQTIKLPCFQKSEKHLLLPAFGSFTGSVDVSSEKNSEFYLLMQDKIIKI